MIRLLLLVLLSACGSTGVEPNCPLEYPQALANGWCCDLQWAWCLDTANQVKGAP